MNRPGFPEDFLVYSIKLVNCRFSCGYCAFDVLERELAAAGVNSGLRDS